MDMIKIDVTNWKSFPLSEMFVIKLSKGDIQAKKMCEGDIPLVSAGKFNNGICKYIEKGDGRSEIFKGNIITIDMFGKSFYQAQPFYAVSHGRVNILLPKFELNKTIALFIVSVLDSTFLAKYSFSGMCNQTELTKTKIKLPVDSTGSPDYVYMEKYMEHIMEKQRANLLVLQSLR